MPRGRIISQSIAGSDKLSSVSERAFAVYIFNLFHDSAGRRPADDVALLLSCGRFGYAHGYTAEDMAAARDELVRAELWRLYTTAKGKMAVEVVGWQEHQRDVAREAPSTLLAADELNVTTGRAVASTITSSTEEPPPAIDGFILRAWRAAMEDILKRPVVVRPKDHEAAVAATKLKTCTSWTNEAELAKEMARQVRRLEKGGYASGLRAVLNNLGNRSKDDGSSSPDDRTVDISREQSQKLIAEMHSAMAAPSTEDKARVKALVKSVTRRKK